MEELFFRAIERVGFPVATAALSFFAVYKLFNLRETERNSSLGILVVEAKKQTESLNGISHKIDVNNDVTTAMAAKLGSDPNQICKAGEMSVTHSEIANLVLHIKDTQTAILKEKERANNYLETITKDTALAREIIRKKAEADAKALDALAEHTAHELV